MDREAQPARVASARRPHGRPGLTRDQLALIHVARRECRLEEDEYRALLLDVAGVTSARQLDAAAFTRVLERFKAIGFVHRHGAPCVSESARLPGYGQRRGMATDAQIQLITSLWKRWAGTPDECAMNRWVERSFGVTSLRFATVHIAQQAIDGLRAMVERKASVAGAKQAPDGRPGSPG